MNAVTVALAVHRSFSAPKTLLVDDDLASAFSAEKGAACLSQLGLAPEEMWACQGAGRMSLVVLSASRSARELYRALVLGERLVADKGKILILSAASGESRFEALDVFCGMYPEWTYQLLSSNVIEVSRKESSTSVVTLPGRFLSPEQIPAHAAGRKRVISLAVFGDSLYWEFLPVFVRAHHALFPGWELRIHHDDAIDHVSYGKTLRRLDEAKLVRLVRMPVRAGQGKCEKMLWRLAPAWDPEVEYVMSRDLDALPTWRDRACVEEFIASGAELHVIHDAEAHAGIMGGLCGFRAASLRDLAPDFETFISQAGYSDVEWSKHGSDQHYLNVRVANKLRSFCHSLNVEGHNRPYAMGPLQYVTEIASPEASVVESVSSEVRKGSDALIAYMGVAGFDREKALLFYDVNCPVIDQIKKAEMP